jgi:plasmid stabilization system protein ParE
MPWSIHWTDNAMNALRELSDSREELAEGLGDKLVREVFAAVGTLARFPYKAPPHPLVRDKALRRLVIGKHQVAYRASEEARTITILAVRHERQRQQDPTE